MGRVHVRRVRGARVLSQPQRPPLLERERRQRVVPPGRPLRLDAAAVARSHQAAGRAVRRPRAAAPAEDAGGADARIESSNRRLGFGSPPTKSNS